MTSEDGLIIATELTADTADTGWFEPMLRAAGDAAAAIAAHRGGSRPAPARTGGGIGLVLADAGYCSEDNLTAPGPDRLIVTGKRRSLEKAARDAGAAPAGAGPPPGRCAPGCKPKTASPPTATAATSPRPRTATSSTTWASGS